MEITNKTVRFFIAFISILLGLIASIGSLYVIWIIWAMANFGEHKNSFLLWITCPPTWIGFIVLIGSGFLIRFGCIVGLHESKNDRNISE